MILGIFHFSPLKGESPTILVLIVMCHGGPSIDTINRIGCLTCGKMCGNIAPAKRARGGKREQVSDASLLLAHRCIEGQLLLLMLLTASYLRRQQGRWAYSGASHGQGRTCGARAKANRDQGLLVRRDLSCVRK